MGELLTPEKITLVGVLALAILAFVKGWVVSAAHFKIAKDEAKSAKDECKYWQDRCLEAWGVADRAAVTSRKTIDLARSVVQQAEAGNGDNKPRTEGQP